MSQNILTRTNYRRDILGCTNDRSDDLTQPKCYYNILYLYNDILPRTKCRCDFLSSFGLSTTPRAKISTSKFLVVEIFTGRILVYKNSDSWLAKSPLIALELTIWMTLSANLHETTAHSPEIFSQTRILRVIWLNENQRRSKNKNMKRDLQYIVNKVPPGGGTVIHTNPH